MDQLSNFKQFVELNILESFSKECGQEAIQDMLSLYKDVYLLKGPSSSSSNSRLSGKFEWSALF